LDHTVVSGLDDLDVVQIQGQDMNARIARVVGVRIDIGQPDPGIVYAGKIAIDYLGVVAGLYSRLAAAAAQCQKGHCTAKGNRVLE
jgi:hypothetical protein